MLKRLGKSIYFIARKLSRSHSMNNDEIQRGTALLRLSIKSESLCPMTMQKPDRGCTKTIVRLYVKRKNLEVGDIHRICNPHFSKFFKSYLLITAQNLPVIVKRCPISVMYTSSIRIPFGTGNLYESLGLSQSLYSKREVTYTLLY